AVDHPQGTEIFVDEKFTAPPFPPLKIYTVSEKITPVLAMDGQGKDILSILMEKDDIYLPPGQLEKYQGMTGLTSIVLDPGQLLDDDSMFLIMQGWIFPTDASINYALAQNKKLEIIPPYLQVSDNKGSWITVIDNIGFPMGKDKAVITDLTGKFISDDHRVRIVTNMRIYWDRAFFTEIKSSQIHVAWLSPSETDLHYRGFSKMFRKGGRYGPHWFDYDDVSVYPRYNDLEGNYTRYGDVLPLLMEADDMYIISNAGDEITIKFNSSTLPAPGPGFERDFLLHNIGWVKDGDLNTATGNTVDPLPYHGMNRYPYQGPGEFFPSDEKHRKYLEEYSTRYVDGQKFKRALVETGKGDNRN
ncbi:MAG TPA: hypothetical protein VI583_14290, partial [Cyclobacteriaceae bacterium]|nr:hypothetical protein [Cyclobacteriaceae bacterium]